METTSIDLPGCEIESITFEVGVLRVRFSRAYIVKTLTGSEERTRWWQAGEMILEGAEVEGELPAAPCVCDGGDVGENVYTYRDMVPLPLESRGRAHCALKIRDSGLVLKAQADGIKLVMDDRPHYIEHIKPE
ncbi:MAG: hypothetical protein DIZ77_14250 [endosymbiont of Seepiophila jonesi]|uniref:Uncharacterized protein n=1 Tax=endosymbiont of Lamellibrachia luymesi TaxID=2200907 RepID=A0A370E0E1_9GAMM|nr:MAG: hypothetical protein DIZ77_14250 [endosymbiont of Seepiophila jonesi]RDH92874.1 MAG: hypothetical protein DIZ79_02220 [endosymbiont of Lamellibrachia luymesi]